MRRCWVALAAPRCRKPIGAQMDPAAAAAAAPNQLIASESVLEEWQRQPAAERKLDDSLRGVVAETACTGVIRYPWPLLRPLLCQLMLEQLTEFEAAEPEVGPARPMLSAGTGSSALECSERFAELLAAFTDAPWTLQRLCELLLEPRKQYRRLHKLVLALEKLLLVTGEVGVSADPGPPPRLSELAAARVNEPPPPPAGSTPAPAAGSGAAAEGAAAGQKRPRQDESDASGLVSATLEIRQAPSQAATSAEAAAEQEKAAAADAANGDGAAVAASSSEAAPAAATAQP